MFKNPCSNVWIFYLYLKKITMTLDTEAIIKKLDILIRTVGGSTSSLTPVVITSTVVTDDNTVAAGSRAVTFTTSDDYTGNINGVARAASTSYVFNPTTGHTNPAITYTTTTGSITIDLIV
jgi:hypothetical protein